MPSTDQEIIPIIIAGTAILLMLGMFIVSFLFFYQRKHNNHIAEKKSLKAAFDQELLKIPLPTSAARFTIILRRCSHL